MHEPTMTVENSGAVAARVPPSWDETFMQLARVYAQRSKDPGTQVGAVIAGADHRQLSAGCVEVKGFVAIGCMAGVECISFLVACVG